MLDKFDKCHKSSEHWSSEYFDLRYKTSKRL